MAISHYRKKRRKISVLYVFLLIVILFVFFSVLSIIPRSQGGYILAIKQYEEVEKEYEKTKEKLRNIQQKKAKKTNDLEIINNKKLKEIGLRGVGTPPEEDRAFEEEDANFYIYPSE